MSDYIQVARIRGTEEKYKSNMHKNDFYILCRKNPKDNIGLRSKGMIVFLYNEVNIDYLCSNFVRFCLSLYKNNQNIDAGEMSIIPKQPIPISEELREYIEDFLPDFYGIRK